MKLKLTFLVLLCAMSGMLLTGCSGDSTTTTAPSTNSVPAPKTN